MGLGYVPVARRTHLPQQSIRRHWLSHVPADRKAILIGQKVFGRDGLDTVEKIEKEKTEERDNLFLRLRAQRSLLWELVNPQKNPDKKSQVQAHRVLLALTELIARVLGEIQPTTTVTNNTLNVGASGIAELRVIIETALQDEPRARTKLLAALANGLPTERLALPQGK
jgi:hypothetical protein